MFGARLLERGNDFLKAFENLTREGDPDPLWPAYFLLAHALELLLKACLASRGWEKRRLRDVRHQLIMLLDHCVAEGLPDAPNLPLLTRNLDEVNRDHDFRYPSRYTLILPHAREASVIMRELVSVVSGPINDAAFRAHLHLMGEMRHLGNRKYTWNE